MTEFDKTRLPHVSLTVKVINLIFSHNSSIVLRNNKSKFKTDCALLQYIRVIKLVGTPVLSNSVTHTYTNRPLRYLYPGYGQHGH